MMITMMTTMAAALWLMKMIGQMSEPIKCNPLFFAFKLPKCKSFAKLLMSDLTCAQQVKVWQLGALSIQLRKTWKGQNVANSKDTGWSQKYTKAIPTELAVKQNHSSEQKEKKWKRKWDALNGGKAWRNNFEHTSLQIIFIIRLYVFIQRLPKFFWQSKKKQKKFNKKQEKLHKKAKMKPQI